MTSRPVVVGVPASGGFSALLAFAAAHAARTGGGLHLVHAFDDWPVMAQGDTRALYLRHAEGQADALLRRARAELEELAIEVGVVTARTVHGPVVDSLVEASEEADLVVVQRRHHSGAARLLSRSVSSAVAARAHGPVAVVPERAVPPRHGVVAVGVDEPERSAVLVEQALLEAFRRGADLRVLHLLWHAGGLGEYLVEQATATRHLAAARAAVEALVTEAQRACPQVSVEVDVRREDPADALVLESRRTDVLLVGRHDLAIPVGSHLGPVAGAVVRESRCPVLVVAPTRRHRRQDP